jgi:hypothetical protein
MLEGAAIPCSRNTIMKSLLLALATGVTGAFLACGPAVAAPRHDRGAAARSVAPSTRWAADGQLRGSMARVRKAIDELDAYAPGAVPRDVALQRVDDIEDATRMIFAHCHLPPGPDAALHGMLVPLLAAADAFRRDPTDRSAIAAMRKAIADFPVLFADPGWLAPEARAGDARVPGRQAPWSMR